MGQTGPQTQERYLLEPTQRLRHARQMMRDFEAFLAPGERLDVQVEFASTFRLAQLKIFRPDRSFELTLEASMMADDMSESLDTIPGEVVIERLLAFLNVHLYEFFRSDRMERFHPDWKLYPFDGSLLRFRAERSSPLLEQQADALLDDPDVD